MNSQIPFHFFFFSVADQYSLLMTLKSLTTFYAFSSNDQITALVNCPNAACWEKSLTISLNNNIIIIRFIISDRTRRGTHSIIKRVLLPVLIYSLENRRHADIYKIFRGSYIALQKTVV